MSFWRAQTSLFLISKPDRSACFVQLAQPMMQEGDTADAVHGVGKPDFVCVKKLIGADIFFKRVSHCPKQLSSVNTR